MRNMKKYIGQIITIGLCVALLFVTIAQGKKLDELSQKLDSKIDSVKSDLQWEIANISGIVESELEEMERVVSSSEFKTVGIDKENRQVLAEATVCLKEWYKDTEVILYITIGDEILSITMTADGNGMFSAIVGVPCETDAKNMIELDILVSGGGMIREESLGTWGDISMLLPLQSYGRSWMGPADENGILARRFKLSVKGQNGAPNEVNNPEFWVYKNGELAQKIEAVQENSCSPEGKTYSADVDDIPWSIECEPGDNIVVRFRCEDAYGLGYDFLFVRWMIEATGDNNQIAREVTGIDEALILNWPE